jgi:hypothetical protein
VTVTDINGCSGTATAQVTIVGPPSVVITPDATSICAGGTATLVAAGSGGTGPYNFTWSTTQTTSVIQVSPTSTTQYFVTVTDANGCTGINSVTINVLADPVVNINVNNVEVCINDPVSLSATVTG